MGQLFLPLVVLLLAGGYVSSVPYFGFEDEIEAFRPLARTDSSLDTADALDDAVITSENGGFDSSSIFQPQFSHFPFHNRDEFPGLQFSPFGLSSFGFGNVQQPWWMGRNVCVDRVENEENEGGADDDKKEPTEDFVKPPNFFGAFHMSVDSCVEKPHKYYCMKISSRNGVRRNVTVTRQCCQGYGRPPNAERTMECQKVEVKTFDEAAKDMGGNEFIRSVKNNGLEGMLSSNITVFLPTNDAFTKFSEMMFENNLVYVPMGSRRRRGAHDQFGFTSKDLLMNHMVDGLNTIEDLVNEDVLRTKLGNSTIRINIYNRNRRNGILYTANCAPMSKIDQIVTNGVMHSVDMVLAPVQGNVMDIIRQRSDMAVFKTILEKTELSKLLEQNNPVTVFAPTDKAFEKLDMNLRRKLKEGKGCAANILKSHLLDFTLCSKAVNDADKVTAYNVLGDSLRFELGNNSDAETEVEFPTTVDEIVINRLARIVESDIVGTNGVLHVVDAILPSDISRSVSSLMGEKKLNIFKSLVEASGLESEFNDYDNVTIFAPVDKAFEDSEWAKKLEENPEQLKDNAELKDFLRGHVIQPKIKTCDLKEDLVKTVSGSELRINLYSTHSIFTNVMNRATVNCARLTHFDDESCGSILHQLDKQLENPKNNLLQLLESNRDYSIFFEAVKLANLTSLLSDDTDSYTVFLPKNEVFKEFNVKVPSTPEEATTFVQDYIVNDIVCCSGIAPTNWPFVRTIEAISGNHLQINRERRPTIEDAMITKCDALATNGIVHEINDVIITKPKRRTASVDKPKYDILRDVFF